MAESLRDPNMIPKAAAREATPDELQTVLRRLVCFTRSWSPFEAEVLENHIVHIGTYAAIISEAWCSEAAEGWRLPPLIVVYYRTPDRFVVVRVVWREKVTPFRVLGTLAQQARLALQLLQQKAQQLGLADIVIPAGHSERNRWLRELLAEMGYTPVSRKAFPLRGAVAVEVGEGELWLKTLTKPE